MRLVTITFGWKRPYTSADYAINNPRSVRSIVNPGCPGRRPGRHRFPLKPAYRIVGDQFWPSTIAKFRWYSWFPQMSDTAYGTLYVYPCSEGHGHLFKTMQTKDRKDISLLDFGPITKKIWGEKGGHLYNWSDVICRNLSNYSAVVILP